PVLGQQRHLLDAGLELGGVAMHVEGALVDRLILDALRAHQLVHHSLAVLAETELDERVAARALGRALAQEAQPPRVQQRAGGEPDADRRLRAAQRWPE